MRDTQKTEFKEYAEKERRGGGGITERAEGREARRSKRGKRDGGFEVKQSEWAEKRNFGSKMKRVC